MEPTLGRRLYLGHRAVHDELDGRLHEHGASLWNWVLLREAAEHDGASQRELAELMHIEPPTLVRHLDKLAEEGLVERRTDPADRRVAPRRRHRRGARAAHRAAQGRARGRRRAARDPDQARDRGAGSRAHADPRLLRPGRARGVDRAGGVPSRAEASGETIDRGGGVQWPLTTRSSAPSSSPRSTRVRSRRSTSSTSTVHRGEIFGLLGPNGAGKTTTAGMLTTRVIPTSGRAFVGGVDVVAHPTAAKQVIGVVPQTQHARPLAHGVGEPLLPRPLLRDVERERAKPRPTGCSSSSGSPTGRRRRCSRSPAAWPSG